MKKLLGFSLIELMISLVVGLIVVAATISIYIATVRSSADTIRATRLNHDLESVMTLMINDIRRSGYWGGALMEADSRNNPFTAATTNIQIHGGNCILYTYDADGSGIVDVNATTGRMPEQYGFKLDGTTIRIRKSGTTTASGGCGTTNQEWEEFIDGSQLTITALQFNFEDIASPDLPATSRCINISTAPPTITNATNCTPTASGNNLVQKRIVNIVLAGRLTSDPTVTKSVNGTVEIRNNRLILVP